MAIRTSSVDKGVSNLVTCAGVVTYDTTRDVISMTLNYPPKLYNPIKDSHELSFKEAQQHLNQLKLDKISVKYMERNFLVTPLNIRERTCMLFQTWEDKCN